MGGLEQIMDDYTEPNFSKRYLSSVSKLAESLPGKVKEDTRQAAGMWLEAGLLS